MFLMSTKKPIVIAIAALGDTTRYIGKDGGLLWKLRKDMEHFKECTTGHPVIMGRKTWDSLPTKYRPLVDRSNIVITSDQAFTEEGVTVARSLDEALELAHAQTGSEEIYIIGGARLYTEVVERGLADLLELTLVQSLDVGDVQFPKYEETYNKVLARGELITEIDTSAYYFCTLGKG